MDITVIFEIIGTIAFAASGAFVAMKYRLDLFGLLCSAVVTATGGGMCRDIILGNTPPLMFRDPSYVIIAVLAGLLTSFVYEPAMRSSHKGLIITLINICDALGLSVFTIVGMRTAIALGYDGNAFLVCFVGVISAVGGGILRDLLNARRPIVLHKEIYATAAILGAILYYNLRTLLPDGYAACAAMILIFSVRLIALRYNLNLPRAGERFE